MGVLEGNWYEYRGMQLMAGDIINFSFDNNKFVYTYEEFGDVPFRCDNGIQTYMTKDIGEGVFEINNNTITLSGTWLESSCYNRGKFKVTYVFKVLNPYLNLYKLNLHLVNAEGSVSRGFKSDLNINKK